MNIWIFNHYAITPATPGGTRHFDLAREMVNRGHQVTIFASSFHHGRRHEMKLTHDEKWKVEDIHGIRFVWLRTFPYQRNNWRRVLNMVSYMLRAWRLGRKLPEVVPELKNPDVLIGSSVHLLAVLAAYWVAKHYRARFIMEVRDLWPQAIIDLGEMSEKSPVIKALQYLEQFLYRKAERIVTLGPGMAEYITARGIGEEKIAWIPNGVDLSRFEGIESRDSSNSGFKVMYLGAHGQANGIDVLLQSAKIVQDRGREEIRFILIGDGPEKPRLIKLAKQLGLSNTEFHNAVAKSVAPRVLQEADAAVFILNDLSLCRFGTSSNKLYDYLAARKPVIIAADPINNPVEEARCGLTVPPRNPEALAETIIELSRIPKEEREAMGRRGREYVKKYHSIPVLADKLIECIENILAN